MGLSVLLQDEVEIRDAIPNISLNEEMISCECLFCPNALLCIFVSGVYCAIHKHDNF